MVYWIRLTCGQDQFRFFQNFPQTNCPVVHSPCDWPLSTQAVNGGDTILMTKSEQ